MRRNSLSLLFLLLLAVSPALAGESPRAAPAPPTPSLLARLWHGLTELLPLAASSQAPGAQDAELPSDSTPDLGLGMDPDG